MNLKKNMKPVCSILYNVMTNKTKGDLGTLTKGLACVEDEEGKQIIQGILNVENRLRESFVPDVQINFTQYLTAALAEDVREMVIQNASHYKVIKVIENNP